MNLFLKCLGIFSVILILSCEKENRDLLDDEIVTDSVIPSTPSNLTTSSILSNTITLKWNASTDNISVKGYKIYQDDLLIVIVEDTSYEVKGLEENTQYSFKLIAFDEEGNESNFSNLIKVTTLNSTQKTAVLIYTKTLEYRHESIDIGVKTISTLGTNNDFELTHTENSNDFNDSNLSKFQLVIFLNTTGDVLNELQQSAFENYIRGGGSYMGVHAATDTEYDWTWYGQLVGGYFDNHPESQTAGVNVIDSNHLSTSHLTATWTRFDEWYNFKEMNPNIIPILNIDESSYSGGEQGDNHPISWYHEFDGGRSFYTGMGHTKESYDEVDFQKHLLGGILYCLNR